MFDIEGTLGDTCCCCGRDRDTLESDGAAPRDGCCAGCGYGAGGDRLTDVGCTSAAGGIVVETFGMAGE